jgi:hypothetical protein
MSKVHDEMHRIKQWSQKIREIIYLSTIIERQEERDKHTIGLAGVKEVKLPSSNESPRGGANKKENAVL